MLSVWGHVPIISETIHCWEWHRKGTRVSISWRSVTITAAFYIEKVIWFLLSHHFPQDGCPCCTGVYKTKFCDTYFCFILCTEWFDYGLDDRAIGVRSPAGAKDFSSILCVQTGSGANPTSCPVGTEGPFPGGKARPGRDADHSPPSSAEVVNE
jgi:hypothetical protein